MTSAELLSYVPWIAIVWTSISLAWGVYIGCSYTYMIYWASKNVGYVRKSDTPMALVLHAVNLFLLSYLWSDNILSVVGDSILIVNLFYCTLLVAVTFQLIRWARADQVQQLVTS